MIRLRIGRALLSALLCLCSSAAPCAISPQNVAVIVNTSPFLQGVSRRVAEYYCAQRGVPLHNIIEINVSAGDAIAPEDFSGTSGWNLAGQIREKLVSQLGVDPNDPAHDPIQCLVLCYGVPFRVNFPHVEGLSDVEAASVDSWLTLLFNHDPDVAATRASADVGMANPYCGKDMSFDQFRASPANLTHVGEEDYSMRYLVCRLDAYAQPTVSVEGYGTMPQDVKDMIERGRDSEGETGRFVLDNAWYGDGGVPYPLYSTASVASVVDSSLVINDPDDPGQPGGVNYCYVKTFDDSVGVIAYASYGMHDEDIIANTEWGRPYFRWKPGALCIINESYSGASLREGKFVEWPAVFHPEENRARLVPPTPLDSPVLKLGPAQCGPLPKNLTGCRMALLKANGEPVKWIRGGVQVNVEAYVGSNGVAEIDLSDPTIQWLPQNGHMTTKVRIYFPDDDKGFHDGEQLTADGADYELSDRQDWYEVPGDYDLYQAMSNNKGWQLPTLGIYRQRIGEFLHGARTEENGQQVLHPGPSGAAAAVSEPAGAGVDTSTAFSRYAEGYSWAEAAYMATARLGYKMYILGDPLMTPYVGMTPYVSILLGDQQVLTGKVGISANAHSSPDSNTGVRQVDFYITNSSDVYDRISTAYDMPFSCTLDTQPYSDGVYSIVAVAYEAGSPGEVGQTAKQIIIDNTGVAGDVSITEPSPNARLSDSVQVAAQCDTTLSVTSVSFWLAGENRTRLVGTTTGPDYTATLDTTTYQNGSYQLFATAHWISETEEGIFGGGSIPVTIDNTGLWEITAPADGTVVSGQFTVDVGVNVAGPPAVGQVQLHLTCQDGTTCTVGPDTEAPYSLLVDTQALNLPDGLCTIKALLVKEGGNHVAEPSAPRTVLISNQHQLCERIRDARMLPDETKVLLQAKHVVAGTANALGGRFWIEEEDRSSGIEVAPNGVAIERDAVVTVIGVVDNGIDSGARRIATSAIYVLPDAADTITPLMMPNLWVGGRSPTGEECTNGASNGQGLYNVGSLVTTTGRVVYVGSNCVYIDDGSAVHDGNSLPVPTPVPLDGSAIPATSPGVTGLWVYMGEPPECGIDDQLVVTGISSLWQIGVSRAPWIIVRNGDDIVRHSDYTNVRADSDGLLGPGGYVPVGTTVRTANDLVLTNDNGTLLRVREDADVWPQGLIEVQASTALQPGSRVTILGEYAGSYLDENEGELVFQITPHRIYAHGVSDTGFSRMLSARLRSPDSQDESSAGGVLSGRDIEIGSIGYALSQPDGTRADLIGEMVISQSADSSTFGLKEVFEPLPESPRLVLSACVPGLQLNTKYAQIDIIGGTMGTLTNGQRCIRNPEAVWLYTDGNGNPCAPMWTKAGAAGAMPALKSRIYP